MLLYARDVTGCGTIELDEYRTQPLILCLRHWRKCGVLIVRQISSSMIIPSPLNQQELSWMASTPLHTEGHSHVSKGEYLIA